MNAPFIHHHQDVLTFVRDKMRAGTACALVVVLDTEGGGVRAKGALMSVTENGEAAGYVSNGCVDADVILAAQSCIQSGETRDIRYGVGSPFLDIRLPCGGSLDLRVLPVTDLSIINDVVECLDKRKAVTIAVSIFGELTTGNTGDGDAFVMTYEPKLRLRIVGRGVEPLYLARAALAADMEVILQSPDMDCVSQAKDLAITAQRIDGEPDQTAQDDDVWTAVVFLFHDHDQEPKLLMQALSGPAFYIGALGSRKTHETRKAVLEDMGVSAQQIARVRGPIGLIPSLRDASTVAISTLAEIVRVDLERRHEG